MSPKKVISTKSSSARTNGYGPPAGACSCKKAIAPELLPIASQLAVPPRSSSPTALIWHPTPLPAPPAPDMAAVFAAALPTCCRPAGLPVQRRATRPAGRRAAPVRAFAVPPELLQLAADTPAPGTVDAPIGAIVIGEPCRELCPPFRRAMQVFPIGLKSICCKCRTAAYVRRSCRTLFVTTTSPPFRNVLQVPWW